MDGWRAKQKKCAGCSMGVHGREKDAWSMISISGSGGEARARRGERCEEGACDALGRGDGLMEKKFTCCATACLRLRWD